jgi:molybdopterin synthase sulfur carrier subunit
MTAPDDRLHILYFAWLRERIGHAEEHVEFPDAVGDVAGLIDWLRARSPGHEKAFTAAASIRCAVNQEFAGAHAPVRPGDEVAFFPPVTGG